MNRDLTNLETTTESSAQLSTRVVHSAPDLRLVEEQSSRHVFGFFETVQSDADDREAASGESSSDPANLYMQATWRQSVPTVTHLKKKKEQKKSGGPN